MLATTLPTTRTSSVSSVIERSPCLTHKYSFTDAPNPQYQQYFPIGQPGRAPYQASPAAPAGPILGQAVNKPATVPTAQSPYAHQSYPSAGGYDDNSYLNRFNDNKLGQQQPAQQGYQAQGGLHNFLGAAGQGTAASGRTGNDEDIYKNGSLGSLARGQGAASLGQTQGQQQQTAAPQQQQQPQQPQQQQQQFPSYGYTNAYPPQQNDWSSYAQYGSRVGNQQGYWGQ